MKTHLPTEIVFRRDNKTPQAIFEFGVRRERDKILRLITGMRASDMGFVDERVLQRIFEEDPTQAKYPTFFFTLLIEDWLRRYF